MPDLKFKNLVFTTAAGGSGTGGSDDTGNGDADEGNSDGTGDNGGNSDGTDGNTGGTALLTGLAAEFEKIKNNPHYVTHKLSRTLYQVD